MPVAQYFVRMKDPLGNTLAVFDTWRDLRFSHRINSSSWYQFFVGEYDDRVNLFALNNRFEINRRIPGHRGWYKEFEGFHRTLVRQVFLNGNRQFISDGRGYLDLVAGRIVAYRSGSSGAEKSGPAETVIKDYVRENVGPLATVGNGRLRDGTIPNFTIEADSGGGDTWEGSRAFLNLLEVIQKVGEEGGVDFNVVSTSDTSWQFYTKIGQLGDDRTSRNIDLTTGKNAAGNIPVVFSIGVGNMVDPIYSYSRTDESNVVYMLGEGEKEKRVIEPVINATAIADAPLSTNIREVSRSSSTKSVAALIASGEEYLTEVGAKETLSFKVMQQPSSIYGLHYNVGDLVTARFEDLLFHKKIIAVTINYNGNTGEEDIDIEFSDIPGE